MDEATIFQENYNNFYRLDKKTRMMDIPPMGYLMVDGVGEPGGEAYQESVSLLYSVTFTIKMSKKGAEKLDGYFEYKTPALEGLWSSAPFDPTADRKSWKWTSLMLQPSFVTPAIVEWAKEKAAVKKPELDYSKLRFERYGDGICVQCLHIGPYSEEPATIQAMETFAGKSGYRTANDPARRHHEIYMTSPTRSKPENLKTILRIPVKPV